jgi:hypothetical protein
MAEGRGITETEPSSRAGQEIAALAEEILMRAMSVRPFNRGLKAGKFCQHRGLRVVHRLAKWEPVSSAGHGSPQVET